MKFNLLACIMYGSEFFQDAVYYKYSSALPKAIYRITVLCWGVD